MSDGRAGNFQIAAVHSSPFHYTVASAFVLHWLQQLVTCAGSTAQPLANAFLWATVSFVRRTSTSAARRLRHIWVLKREATKINSRCKAGCAPCRFKRERPVPFQARKCAPERPAPRRAGRERAAQRRGCARASVRVRLCVFVLVPARIEASSVRVRVCSSGSPTARAPRPAASPGCLACRGVWARARRDASSDSYDLCLVLELVDKGFDRVDLDARAALGRLVHMEGGQVAAKRHAQVGERQLVQLLLLGLHDVGQRGVARLVEAQVGGDHGGQRHAQRLEPAVDLARHAQLALARNLQLGREGALRPAQQRSQHLACAQHEPKNRPRRARAGKTAVTGRARDACAAQSRSPQSPRSAHVRACACPTGSAQSARSLERWCAHAREDARAGAKALASTESLRERAKAPGRPGAALGRCAC
eukprot:963482-Pleurochrysis_carterae.AAC.4